MNVTLCHGLSSGPRLRLVVRAFGKIGSNFPVNVRPTRAEWADVDQPFIERRKDHLNVMSQQGGGGG